MENALYRTAFAINEAFSRSAAVSIEDAIIRRRSACEKMAGDGWVGFEQGSNSWLISRWLGEFIDRSGDRWVEVKTSLERIKDM